MSSAPLFDRISWRDPLSGRPMKAIVVARTPAGVPISGALQVEGTSCGYPIVDSVARITPELARYYAKWLEPFNLSPPIEGEDSIEDFQVETTVSSFGWQWSLAGNMRSDADLRMRVADNFRLQPDAFLDKLVLDAGAGAGDQSRYLIQQGALVVSIDLSGAIEMVVRKLRMEPMWVGVQGDITVMPFTNDQFDIVYCEGVLQHTRNSIRAISELGRVARHNGIVLARHYTMREPRNRLHAWRRRTTQFYYRSMRNRLSRMDGYKRLLVTGVLAALGYIPFLGYLLKRTSTVLYYDLQPDFKTTWINTHDYYGGHEYQRFITPEEFWGYFEQVGNLEMIYKDDGGVMARKRG